LEEHVNSCRICSAANKRVNDFCPAGKVLFYEFAQHNAPISAEVLSEEESAKVRNEIQQKRREAHNN
jgi:hypothetical protein